MRPSLAATALCVLAGLLMFGSSGAIAGHVESYGLVFVADGARGDVVYDIAMNGYKGRVLLPNIRKYFIDQGLWVKEATGVFPTITGAGMPSVLTGCFPGRNDMPSLYFFDRKQKKYPVLYVPLEAMEWNKWLSPEVKTIWEHFDGPNDSISFGPALSRGSDSHVPIVWNLKYKPMEFRGQLAVGWRALKRSVMGGLPARLTLVYNGWFDHMEHSKGSRSDAIVEDYIQLDKQIGETMECFMDMVREREKAGAEVRHFACFVSDHGHQDIHKVVSIDDFVRKQQGARVLDKVWRRLFGVKLKGDLPKDFSPYDLVVASGEGHALLYFPSVKAGADGKPVKDWDHRPPLALLRQYPYHGAKIDIPATASELPAGSFLVGKDAGTGKVHVFGTAGESTIEQRREPAGLFCRYTVVKGEDPLGFRETEQARGLIDGQFHSAREWQLATLSTNYPDAPVVLYQVFDSKERAADLFLSAAPFISIGDLVDGDTSKSKHGGLTKDEGWPTLAFTGWGIKPGLAHTARNIDMVPTMLTLLGQDYDPDALDGEPVAEVVECLHEAMGSTLPPSELRALGQAADQLVGRLGKGADGELQATAAALQTILARPGLEAGEVRAWRRKAFAALAARKTPAARALLRGELPGEFLLRPRGDLASAAPAPLGKSDPAIVEGLVRDAAVASYRTIFQEMEGLFQRAAAPSGKPCREALARMDLLLETLAALHDAGFTVPAPRFSFDTYRLGINLWIEGVEKGPHMSSASRAALARFTRIESARAEGPIRRTFFDLERASLQVEMGKRLEKFRLRLAARPSKKAVALQQALAGLPAGQTRAAFEALSTYGRAVELAGTVKEAASASAAGPIPAGANGSGELDAIYRGMGAR